MKVQDVKIEDHLLYKLNEVESFPFPDDWDLNNKILDDSVAAFMQDVEVNYDYDIPYVAGYNVKGTVVYIDKDLPKGYKQKNGKNVQVEKYLVLHECVEKALLQRFKNLIYETSHQLALRLEQAAVQGDGVDWKEYNDFFVKWIKKCGDEKIQNAPSDLDLTPYVDEEDTKVLDNLKRAMR